jgi:hypothetical protein
LSFATERVQVENRKEILLPPSNYVADSNASPSLRLTTYFNFQPALAGTEIEAPTEDI